MRELRTYGFVRGVLGDRHPYRDSRSVFSNIGARENDGNRLSRCNCNQMHVQAMQHLAFSLLLRNLIARTTRQVETCWLSEVPASRLRHFW